MELVPPLGGDAAAEADGLHVVAGEGNQSGWADGSLSSQPKLSGMAHSASQETARMEESKAIIGSSGNSGGVRVEGGERQRHDLRMVGRGGVVGRGGCGCGSSSGDAVEGSEVSQGSSLKESVQHTSEIGEPEPQDGEIGPVEDG